MATTALKAEQIADVFKQLDRQASDATRDATRTAANPGGDNFGPDTMVWWGTIREAWEQEKWPALAREINDAREEEGLSALDWSDFEANQAEIEEVAKERAESVIGQGRPLVVAFLECQYPAVYCEDGDLDAVRESAGGFYDWS